ncbi:MAG: cell division protein SepF [Lachnospiraceae bacterium]|nr:cell division protein SepF [Lachnospiraceae bacterium]
MSKKKGVIDMIVKGLGMNGEEDEYYDGLDDDYYDEAGSNIEPFRRTNSAKEDMDYPEPERPKKASSKPALASRSARRTVSASGSSNEVCVIKPTSVEEAREVTETLLANRVVVLNLEGLDVDIAQRIIDFTSGSTYAISGNLQKISRYIFIITPASVDISGDFQDLLSGTFSQSGPQRLD